MQSDWSDSRQSETCHLDIMSNYWTGRYWGIEQYLEIFWHALVSSFPPVGNSRTEHLVRPALKHCWAQAF